MIYMEICCKNKQDHSHSNLVCKASVKWEYDHLPFLSGISSVENTANIIRCLRFQVINLIDFPSDAGNQSQSCVISSLSVIRSAAPDSLGFSTAMNKTLCKGDMKPWKWCFSQMMHVWDRCCNLLEIQADTRVSLNRFQRCIFPVLRLISGERRSSGKSVARIYIYQYKVIYQQETCWRPFPVLD